MGLEESIICIQATHAVPQPNPQIRTEQQVEARSSTVLDAILLTGSATDNTTTYVAWIEGLKGLLAVESFLWLFFRSFLPAVVYAGVLDPEPAWETILRKIFSPVLWDGTLQWSFFIILSGRVTALRFLQHSTPKSMAMSIFKRPFRFFLPIVLAMSLAALINYRGGFDHIAEFAVVAKHDLVTAPFKYHNALAWLNSMFNLFWFQDALQAGVLAHPAGQLWIVTTAFLQRYTIYMTMLLLPYMVRVCRVQLLVLFILTAWWVNSWAWYSVTGLIIADNIETLARWGRESWLIDVDKSKIRFRIPYWTIPAFLLAVGVGLKYFYVVLRPDLYTNELNAHTSTYLVGGTIEGYVDYSRPAMRLDNYFVVLGGLLLIEMTPWLQTALSWKFLQYLGHLSLSAFLLQGCITYTLGTRLFIHFVRDLEWNTMSAAIVILVVDGGLIWLSADVFARLVDFQGKRLSLNLYAWFVR